MSKLKQRSDGRYQKSLTINGKRHVFYGKSEKEILQNILNYQEKEEKGKLLKEVSDEWEENHYKNIEHSTKVRYEIFVKAFIGEFENRYIKTITAIEIEHFLLNMVALQYSTKTIKDQFSIIKMIYKCAMMKQYITTDATAYIKIPKGKMSSKREALTDAEIEIVNNSIDCTFGFLAYFLMYTGLRKGELLALQYKDIDLKNKVIHVNKSVYFENNKPCIKTPKTIHGYREVILLDCLADKIEINKKENYIFGENGDMMRQWFFETHWNKYRKETGLNITAHQFRHTFATILFEANINVKDAQQLMGHSDISVTQNIYTHIREKRLQETAVNLNSYINNVVKK